MEHRTGSTPGESNASPASNWRLVINGKSLSAWATGVQRVVAQVSEGLTARLRSRCIIRKPKRLVHPWLGPLYRLAWEEIYLPRTLRSGDVLWNPANIGPVVRRPSVVTVYDLAVFDVPHGFRSTFTFLYRKQMPRVMDASSLIVTISEFTAKRIASYWPQHSRKTRVVKPGVDVDFFVPGQASEPPYVLYVGSMDPRKNLKSLLDAFAQLTSEYRHLECVVVGATLPHFRKMALSRPAEDVMKRVRWLGFVPDSDLVSLYQGALATVLPSRYEGFGLPALESMSCGVPAIVDRRTALPEVVGDSGVLVDGDSPRDVARGIRSLCRDPSYRAELAGRARVRAKNMSWEKTVEGMVSAFEEAAVR